MTKNFFATVIISLTAVLFVGAQPHKHNPEERAKRETDEMITKLSLTSEQDTLVSAINLKYAKKMQELFQQNGGPEGDFSAMEKNRDEIETQKRGEMEKVLDTDQLKKYDEMVADWKKNRPGPPHDGGPDRQH